MPLSGLLAGPAASRYAPEIDVAVGVPDIDVDAETRGGAAEAYLYTAKIIAGFELQVAHVIYFDTADEFVVLLLLLADGTRRSRWQWRFVWLSEVQDRHIAAPCVRGVFQKITLSPLICDSIRITNANS
jgi:hypothetical protein